MFDIIEGFDILGLGILIGDVLFVAALIWVLVDNRSVAGTAPRARERDTPRRRPRDKRAA